MTTTRDARTGGAVAAGHPLSARAGAEVLARGGNACDALVAAVLASWVCEPTVSGACGGGFLLHRSAAGRVDLLDFFAAAPGLGLERPVQPMESFEVEFGTAVQRFHIGAGSVAVPGTAAGLGAAHRQFGSLPWAELVAPAAALARTDVVQTKAHARLNEILVPVVTLTPESRAVWAPDGHVLTEGETMRQPQLADTLDRLAEAGADDLYTGELADAVVAFSDEAGAALTARDLASYRVIRRRPVEVLFRGYRVRTNAPPSSGGLLLAYGLALHDRLPVADDPLAAAGSAHRSRPSCARSRRGVAPSWRGRCPAAAPAGCSAIRPSSAAGRGCWTTCAPGRSRWPDAPRRAVRATSRWSTGRATRWR